MGRHVNLLLQRGLASCSLEHLSQDVSLLLFGGHFDQRCVHVFQALLNEKSLQSRVHLGLVGIAQLIDNNLGVSEEHSSDVAIAYTSERKLQGEALVNTKRERCQLCLTSCPTNATILDGLEVDGVLKVADLLEGGDHILAAELDEDRQLGISGVLVQGSVSPDHQNHTGGVEGSQEEGGRRIKAQIFKYSACHSACRGVVTSGVTRKEGEGERRAQRVVRDPTLLAQVLQHDFVHVSVSLDELVDVGTVERKWRFLDG